MLRFFPKVTAAEAAQQQQQTLTQITETIQQLQTIQHHNDLLRRKPGRPRKPVLLEPPSDAALAAAVAAPAAKRSVTYNNWLSSPFIHDILAAYQKSGCRARKAVSDLQHLHRRYSTLSESTVRSWHDSNGRLLDKFSSILSSPVPRGFTSTPALHDYPELEAEMVATLQKMREVGAIVNILTIRLTMQAIIEHRGQQQILETLKMSKGWISEWAHRKMNWSWRVRTTAASKLPQDWRQQGVQMAKRIAYNMQLYKVHPSLVVNMDQTGVNLAPVDTRTYDTKGAKAVGVIGAEDKRQITACVASSLDGDLLPLQLIFQGKTQAVHPLRTDSSKKAHVHITHSDNHWSNQETMQQYITEVLVPYTQERMVQHSLPSTSHVVLVLDVWAVHKSEEFRKFLRTHHPKIHLVFVPPNCTSELQVADVILQRPFKCALRNSFNKWAAEIIREQIRDGTPLGLAPYLKMALIKPLILDWCIDAWNTMAAGREYIKMGWHTCTVSLFNVHNISQRQLVVEEVARGELDAVYVPNVTKEAADSSDSEDEDSEKNVLDVMKERQYGKRKSVRKRKQTASHGFSISTDQIAMTEDSD